MLGLAWKGFLGSTLITGALAFYYWSMCQQLTMDNTALRAHVFTLTSAAERQDATIKSLLKRTEDDAALIIEHGAANHELDIQLQAQQNDLAILRNTEAQEALASPYARGNARYNRIYDTLMRLDAYSSTYLGGTYRSSDVEASDTPAPSRREFQKAITYWDRDKCC